jgi:hypothetical protein
MFNFNLASPPQVLIGDKDGVYVNIPEYKDLLANEYIQIETLDKAEAEWNNKLVELADSLAKTKKMNIWDVVEKLDTLDNMDNSAKTEFLGDKMGAMADLAATKPSPRMKQIKIIGIILRSRVSSSITDEMVSSLPQKFLQQISDFIYQEQVSGEHIPYASLKNQYEAVTARLTYTERIIDEVKALLDNPEKNDMTKMNAALEEYQDYIETLGKLQ